MILQSSVPSSLLLLTFLCVTASGCTRNPPPNYVPTQEDALAAQPLRPGDVIELAVWREPDMTGKFPVNENGVAVLPRLGPYDVSKHSVNSLREKLREDFKEFLRNPSIEITVLRRVQILGAVGSPGLYPLDPTMTISDALASAGGVGMTGRRDRVELIRNGVRYMARLSENSRVADLPIQSGDVIYVPPRSWLARNYGFVLTGLTTGLSVAIAILTSRSSN